MLFYLVLEELVDCVLVNECVGHISKEKQSINSLVGSRSLTNLQNQILFIEEVDEYLYHFERMLISLDRCGFLSNISVIANNQVINRIEQMLLNRS